MKTHFFCLLFAFALVALSPAQSTPAPEATEAPPMPAAMPAPADPDSISPDPNPPPPFERTRMRRGNFNPADIQARIMEGIREQMGIKDDTEWAIISERITAVTELRRNQAAAGALGLMLSNRGANRGGNRNGGFASSPEQDTLRSALADNLPDAEISARLAKLREARKQNEAKLDQARENLRAVLTVRQEAVAVMIGLLN